MWLIAFAVPFSFPTSVPWIMISRKDFILPHRLSFWILGHQLVAWLWRLRSLRGSGRGSHWGRDCDLYIQPSPALLSPFLACHHLKNFRHTLPTMEDRKFLWNHEPKFFLLSIASIRYFGNNGAKVSNTVMELPFFGVLFLNCSSIIEPWPCEARELPQNYILSSSKIILVALLALNWREKKTLVRANCNITQESIKFSGSWSWKERTKWGFVLILFVCFDFKHLDACHCNQLEYRKEDEEHFGETVHPILPQYC